MTDSSGIVAQTYKYDAFGNILSQSGTLTNPFTYTGREFDSESGLYYLRARYLDPRIGRFLQEDPIGLDGGDVNFFLYVGQNPINFTDPSGLIIPGDPDPSDEIAICYLVKEAVKRIPWQKVTEVVKETLKRSDIKQIIRKFKLDDKTVGVFHEIWEKTKEGWEIIHRDFKGPWK